MKHLPIRTGSAVCCARTFVARIFSWQIVTYFDADLVLRGWNSAGDDFETVLSPLRVVT